MKKMEGLHGFFSGYFRLWGSYFKGNVFSQYPLHKIPGNVVVFPENTYYNFIGISALAGA
jgi:hypothetical protein